MRESSGFNPVSDIPNKRGPRGRGRNKGSNLPGLPRKAPFLCPFRKRRRLPCPEGRERTPSSLQPSPEDREQAHSLVAAPTGSRCPRYTAALQRVRTPSQPLLPGEGAAPLRPHPAPPSPEVAPSIAPAVSGSPLLPPLFGPEFGASRGKRYLCRRIETIDR